MDCSVLIWTEMKSAELEMAKKYIKLNTFLMNSLWLFWLENKGKWDLFLSKLWTNLPIPNGSKWLTPKIVWLLPLESCGEDKEVIFFCLKILSFANFFVIGIYASISNESRSAFYMAKKDSEVASLGIWVGLLKFRYSEKATKIWKNLPNFGNFRGPSHNIWTLDPMNYS